MVWAYLVALIFGGVLTVPVLIGGFDFDSDSDLDFDADVDVDVDVDVDADLGADLDFDADTGSDFAEFASGILSFRSVVFFLFFFGLAGSLFTLVGTSAPLALVLAVLLGLVSAVLNSALLQALRKGESSSHMTDAEMAGLRAEIIVPPGATGRGRIRALIDGQPTLLSAQAYRSASDQIYSVGDRVVVVEIDNGTALVAPLPASELGDPS